MVCLQILIIKCNEQKRIVEQKKRKAICIYIRYAKHGLKYVEMSNY